MKKNIFLLAGIFLCLSLAGCTNEVKTPPAPELIRPPASEIDTTTIQRGNLVGVIRRTGLTRYLSEPFYFDRPVSRFGEFHVSPGDYVTAGQLIVTLDTEQIEEQIEEQLRRIADMQRDHALAVDLRLVEIDIMVLEHANRVNQAAYNFDQEAAEALEAQTGNIERAQMELRQQQERNRLQLLHAEIRLEDMRARYSAAELHAPFDGRITNVAAISHGDYVGVAQPLLFITDGSQVIIEAVNKPFTSDWPQPGPGGMPSDPWRPNTVRFASRMQAHINGKIFDIEYIPVPFDERSTRPVRFNAVPDTLLTAGEYVALYFYNIFIEDVLLVPENALFFVGPQPYVYRIINGEMVYTEIRLQGRTPLMGAVAYGLQEGDVVFVRS